MLPLRPRRPDCGQIFLVAVVTLVTTGGMRSGSVIGRLPEIALEHVGQGKTERHPRHLLRPDRRRNGLAAGCVCQDASRESSPECHPCIERTTGEAMK